MMGYVEDSGRNPYAAPREGGLAGLDEGGFPGYAGFWARFAALFLDGIIVSILNGVLQFMLGMAMGLVGADPAVVAVLSIIISLTVGFGYYAGLTSSESQATLGKRALGIKVTDLQGRRISFGRAVGRELAKMLSAAILLIGYIMAAFTERKQALHDIIAGTLVVKAR